MIWETKLRQCHTSHPAAQPTALGTQNFLLGPLSPSSHSDFCLEKRAVSTAPKPAPLPPPHQRRFSPQRFFPITQGRIGGFDTRITRGKNSPAL